MVDRFSLPSLTNSGTNRQPLKRNKLENSLSISTVICNEKGKREKDVDNKYSVQAGVLQSSNLVLNDSHSILFYFGK